MKTGTRFLGAAILAAAATGGAPAGAARAAQDPGEAAGSAAPVTAAGGGTLVVQVVAGRLVVACDLSTRANRIPVNLFVEAEGRHGLQLHNKAADALRAESPDGQPRPITMHFQDFTVTVPKRELGDEELFEEFTKYHSAAIGENALVGSIGVEVLSEWRVTYDLGRGRIHLNVPEELSGPAKPPTSVRVESDGTIVAPMTLLDGMVWLPVRWGEGEPGGLMLGTGWYDTRIDESAARERGRPAGDVGPIRIGGLDLHAYVAFRPEPVVQVHPDGVVGVTGINLLEHFSVDVDRARRELRIKETRPPSFPAADLEYFRARAAADPSAVEAFLAAHAAGRLGHEAARLLLDLRLEDEATDPAAQRAAIDSAVDWMFRTMAGDLRTTCMLDLMKEMADAGEDDVVVAAGRRGIEAGREDRYPNAVHEVHGRMGRTLFDRSLREGTPVEDAWRHLLSAAFGLPEDGRINYDLGRFYEHQGRYRRAYSRFVQAVIRPDSGPLALEALQRVQPLLATETGGDDGGEPFSVDTIEKMIAGKVRNFGAASRFEPTDATPVRRTVLCEFFTNGHFGTEERGGAIGGALGFEGMLSHFEPEHVVFLEHHLPIPQPDALCTPFARARAARLGVENPAVIVLDGELRSAGAARWRDAEEVYSRARRAALQRLATHADYEIELDARIEASESGRRRIAGTVRVFGPDEDGLRIHVVLAEAGVLYPGSSGVIVHRHVARASLAVPSVDGPSDPVPSEAGASDAGLDGFPFAAVASKCEREFARTLDEIEAEQLAFLAALEAEGLGTVPRISTRVDPAQARVVAFLVESATGAVLAAVEATPTLVSAEAAEPGEAAGESAPLPRQEGGR